MFIPLNTDAPLHHRPWGTIGLIVVNLLVALLLPKEYYPDLFLPFGDGLTPLQWVTSAFLHAGWMHVLGNMLFLWIFGLVVEGKLGWWKFLALYLGIAIVNGFLQQLIMLGATQGGSLGASGAIVGLIAVAMVWAPENQVGVFFFLNFKTYDWPIWGFAVLFLLNEAISAALDSFRMSTPILHLLGAGCGLPLGILMLKRGWVDCEGWDWFSRRRKEAIPLDARKAVKKAAAPIGPIKRVAPDRTAVREEIAGNIVELLKAGQVDAAWAAYLSESGSAGAWLPRQPVCEILIQSLLKAQRLNEVRPLLSAAVTTWPTAIGPRLAWAQLLLNDKRPAQALEALDALPAAGLTPGQIAVRDRTAAKARELCAQGLLEIDG